MEWTRKKLIKAYIDFYKSKNHKEIANASLVPENDPTVLFTTAGMHPLVPFLLGQKHPLGKRLVNVQKCIRTQDIDEVGDSSHLTFFEMLGNWSLGDYFKEGAIEYSFEFLTKILKIPKEKIAVSVFGGDDRVPQVPKDNESAKIWEKQGIPKERIAFLKGGVYESKNNWWGPTGKTGPCGTDTEFFYWIGKGKPKGNPENNEKEWLEIGNNVLMQYIKTEAKIILVDAVECLITKEGKLNQELAEMLKNINKKIIVVTNASKEEIKNKIGNYNFDIFTLNKYPDKSNPEYFKKLLSSYNLSNNEIIYFDHKKENIESAKKTGIISELYKSNKQIKEWVEKNLFNYIEARQKNVDFGGGVERTVAVLNGIEDVYMTDSFLPIIKKIEKLSGKKYGKNEQDRAMRIIADHIKASVMILAEGIEPSNKEQGYVLRRLIRRAVRYGRELGIEKDFTKQVAESVLEIYEDYKHLEKNKEFIFSELEKEEKRFNELINEGMKYFNKITHGKKQVSGKNAFLLYQSYGFPLEMTLELGRENGIKVDEKGFKEEEKKHQELSRTATEGKFKSGLADKGEETTKLHTATHLLNEALRVVLGRKEIYQKGSNITSERLRFDFNFPRKLTTNELGKVEEFVNQKISEEIDVKREEMSVEEAKKQGAIGVFESKYGEKVSVYSIGNFSKEICAGPHVKNTRELGEDGKKFKIVKEESVAAGVRRIKAVLG